MSPVAVSGQQEQDAVAKSTLGRWCAAVPSKLVTSCHRLRGDLRLAHNAHVMALELLRRARQQGYAGGKSALYALVKPCCADWHQAGCSTRTFVGILRPSTTSG